MLLAICAVGVGCASSDPAATPTTTVTVREVETVVETVAVEDEPVGAEELPLEGSYFSLSYPADWNVETLDEPKGGYFDTTIRHPDDGDIMVRVDVTPGSGLSAAQAAREVEAYLVDEPGYRRIALSETLQNGYDAVEWEFAVRQEGVLLRKSDVFFTTDVGDSYAVLIQAPAAEYGSLLPVLSAVRESVTLPDEISGLTEDSYADGDETSDAEFCATHDCIDNFEEGRGYRVMCADGTWSQSGGIQGACSDHGGVAGGGSDYGYSGSDPNNDGSTSNWCGASRDGDGDGLWCEGR